MQCTREGDSYIPISEALVISYEHWHRYLYATLFSEDRRVLNIACGEGISLNELLRRLNTLLGTSIKPRYEPARKGDVLHSKASIKLAKEKIGYEPKIRFSEGLARYVEWFRKQEK